MKHPSGLRQLDEGHRANRYRLAPLAVEAFGVASLDELHAQLALHLDQPDHAQGAPFTDE